MKGPNRWAWFALVVCAIPGCHGDRKPPGTGASECARRYFEALAGRDWPIAYAALDHASQKSCSLAQFSQRAQSFHASLGFEPTAAIVWACEEREADATAHVVLAGDRGSNDHRSKEAVMLVRSENGWHIVLQPNFGRSMKR